MNPAWLIPAAMLGATLGAFTLGIVASSRTLDDPECPECAGVGAVIETVEATKRPRPVFCPRCPLGHAYMEQAATVVDFAHHVRRGHDGDIHLDGGAR